MDCARQASLSITSSQSLPKLMSIISVMSSNRLILCHLGRAKCVVAEGVNCLYHSSSFLSQEQNSYAYDHWNEDSISHLPDWVLAHGVKASL